MKRVTIKARQTDNGFVVTAFTNTVEVSCGTLLTREQAEKLCSHPRVNFCVLGLEEEKENKSLSLSQGEHETISHELSFDKKSEHPF